MNANQIYEEWLARVSTEAQQKGRAEGRTEGRAEELGNLFSKRLGRRLTEAEAAVLAERMTRLGASRLEDVVLALHGDALAAWLADPGAV